MVGKKIDRHDQWDQCSRCGYRGQIARAPTCGGFLAQLADGAILCWNGRECSLRLRRRRLATGGGRSDL